jgi:hypothetical protein
MVFYFYPRGEFRRMAPVTSTAYHQCPHVLLLLQHILAAANKDTEGLAVYSSGALQVLALLQSVCNFVKPP